MLPCPKIQNLPFLSINEVKVDTLRLDEIHPIISGNKWYKLKLYLQEAKAKKMETIASFGGPYSNHLVALSYAAKLNGFNSIGYVRSNEGEPLTHSMKEAIHYGMDLIYLGRSLFQEKKKELLRSALTSQAPKVYYIDEGGYGITGAMGVSTIFTDFDSNEMHSYDYIIGAVGTGTMIAGIINAAKKEQRIIGIPVLKNEGSIETEIRNILLDKNTPFTLLHEFHHGGYAKTTSELINFMNLFWDHTKVPTDIVYTSKVFYAVNELVHKKYFPPNSKVLVIHSGGLQGNRSLPNKVLNF